MEAMIGERRISVERMGERERERKMTRSIRNG